MNIKNFNSNTGTHKTSSGKDLSALAPDAPQIEKISEQLTELEEQIEQLSTKDSYSRESKLLEAVDRLTEAVEKKEDDKPTVKPTFNPVAKKTKRAKKAEPTAQASTSTSEDTTKEAEAIVSQIKHSKDKRGIHKSANSLNIMQTATLQDFAQLNDMLGKKIDDSLSTETPNIKMPKHVFTEQEKKLLLKASKQSSTSLKEISGTLKKIHEDMIDEQNTSIELPKRANNPDWAKTSRESNRPEITSPYSKNGQDQNGSGGGLLAGAGGALGASWLCRKYPEKCRKLGLGGPLGAGDNKPGGKHPAGVAHLPTDKPEMEGGKFSKYAKYGKAGLAIGGLAYGYNALFGGSSNGGVSGIGDFSAGTPAKDFSSKPAPVSYTPPAVSKPTYDPSLYKPDNGSLTSKYQPKTTGNLLPPPPLLTSGTSNANIGSRGNVRGTLEDAVIRADNGVNLSGLNSGMKHNLTGMANEYYARTGKRLVVTSGYRSMEKQSKLFNEAVRKYGSVAAARKWVAPPGSSMHNHGLAVDIDSKQLNKADSMRLLSKWGFHRPIHEKWHMEPQGIDRGSVLKGGKANVSKLGPSKKTAAIAGAGAGMAVGSSLKPKPENELKAPGTKDLSGHEKGAKSALQQPSTINGDQSTIKGEYKDDWNQLPAYSEFKGDNGFDGPRNKMSTNYATASHNPDEYEGPAYMQKFDMGKFLGMTPEDQKSALGANAAANNTGTPSKGSDSSISDYLVPAGAAVAGAGGLYAGKKYLDKRKANAGTVEKPTPKTDKPLSTFDKLKQSASDKLSNAKNSTSKFFTKQYERIPEKYRTNLKNNTKAISSKVSSAYNSTKTVIANNIPSKGALGLGALGTGLEVYNGYDAHSKATNEHGRDTAIAGTGGSIAGGMAGASLGASVGSVVPGAGTIVGGIVGGIGGSILGEKGTTALMNRFMTKGEDFVHDSLKNKTAEEKKSYLVRSILPELKRVEDDRSIKLVNDYIKNTLDPQIAKDKKAISDKLRKQALNGYGDKKLPTLTPPKSPFETGYSEFESEMLDLGPQWTDIGNKYKGDSGYIKFQKEFMEMDRDSQQAIRDQNTDKASKELLRRFDKDVKKTRDGIIKQSTDIQTGVIPSNNPIGSTISTPEMIVEKGGSESSKIQINSNTKALAKESATETQGATNNVTNIHKSDANTGAKTEQVVTRNHFSKDDSVEPLLGYMMANR
jgi:hypothetical protein